MIQVEDISRVDVIKEGKDWRWDERFQPSGTNVNFIEQTVSGIAIRTFEKGVEDETLSCGTGVTACSLLYLTKHKNETSVEVQTKGGRLRVEAQVDENGFSEVKLIGQVKKVFSGLIDL
jgi:diaminopimelate epimerase